jgi:putative heme-binding domain-containing protein
MAKDYQQFQIDRGASLYSSNCEECHADGTAVPGVNMRTGQFPHGSTDADLMSAIENGIPGTVMPPHDFSSADLAAMVAFVRSLAKDNSPPVKLGDPAKGEALFNANGCLNCHRVGAKGSRVALNLSDTGTLHPPSFLQRALLDPDSILAGEPESRLVRAVTNQGAVINGRRLNEDTYAIQLIDDHENLVSLQKSDLRSLTVIKQSPMPSLKGKLTDAQISDLVAYLATLKSSTDLPAQYGSAGQLGAARAGRGGRGGPGGGGGYPGAGGTPVPNPPAPQGPGR